MCFVLVVFRTQIRPHSARARAGRMRSTTGGVAPADTRRNVYKYPQYIHARAERAIVYICWTKMLAHKLWRACLKMFTSVALAIYTFTCDVFKWLCRDDDDDVSRARRDSAYCSYRGGVIILSLSFRRRSDDIRSRRRRRPPSSSSSSPCKNTDGYFIYSKSFMV